MKDRIAGLRAKGNGKVTTAAELDKCNGVSLVHQEVSATDDQAPPTADPGDTDEDDDGRDYGATDLQPPAVRLHALEVPLCEPPANSNDSLAHLDLRLERQQSNGLRRLYNGLDQAGARLRNGRRVASRGDAVRWLLEQCTGS